MFLASNADKQDSSGDGTDEMDIGDMDKLEQDTGNIGEVLLFFMISLDVNQKSWILYTISVLCKKFNILFFSMVNMVTFSFLFLSLN